MSIVGLIVTLVIIGVILYVINAVIPMDPKVKTIVNAVVIIAVLVWLLGAFGLISPRDFHVR